MKSKTAKLTKRGHSSTRKGWEWYSVVLLRGCVHHHKHWHLQTCAWMQRRNRAHTNTHRRTRRFAWFFAGKNNILVTCCIPPNKRKANLPTSTHTNTHCTRHKGSNCLPVISLMSLSRSRLSSGLIWKWVGWEIKHVWTMWKVFMYILEKQNHYLKLIIKYVQMCTQSSLFALF